MQGGAGIFSSFLSLNQRRIFISKACPSDFEDHHLVPCYFLIGFCFGKNPSQQFLFYGEQWLAMNLRVEFGNQSADFKKCQKEVTVLQENHCTPRARKLHLMANGSSVISGLKRSNIIRNPTRWDCVTWHILRSRGVDDTWKSHKNMNCELRS